MSTEARVAGTPEDPPAPPRPPSRPQPPGGTAGRGPGGTATASEPPTEPARPGARLAPAPRPARTGRPGPPGKTAAGGGTPRYALVVAGLLLALAAAATASLALGSVRIPPGQVIDVLTGRAAGPSPYRTIVLDVRLPRVLLGAVVGAGLAVVGAVLQALVRNRLADPFLLGISSGASAGAVLVLVAGGGVGLVGGVTTTLALPAGAFAGALLSLVLVYGLARRGGTLTSTRLVLAGVAVSYILSALATLLLVVAGRPEQFQEAMYWSLGGLGSARWDTLALPAAVLAVGVGALLTLARPLDLLLVGEEGATVLGLDTARFRAAVFVLASLVTAVMVAASGAVGFVGLMAPHAARLAVGAPHRRLLPVAALGGALALVLADLGARTVAAPQDIPVGILTALTGGPFFLWLMRRRPEGAPL
ncbi:FecCD family ABC transporter permease [Streptomyces sp. NBC_00691]|uniref:FecCD family ABC transporter permease n=1 Tax=Streptomyces sp. NBC_00691 TaxID=2903671 RepID=UPI002E365536|nr:iron ABC transporter permease [Streptomyces sp. NBC_00691]